MRSLPLRRAISIGNLVGVASNEIVVVVKGTVAHCTCNGEILEDTLKIPETGGIGLEADRGQMEYRKIRLKEIK